jgi:membrane fusion protein (multidrug efflux system)
MSSTLRKTLGVLIVLGIVAALALPKLIPGDATAETPATDAGDSEPAALRVSAERVAPEELVERLATTGTLRANEWVELVSETAGKVVAIHFDEGSRVDRGALLVKIDDSELQAELDRVRYRLELAEQREKRQAELLEQGVISQDDYDLVLNQVNVLRSELRLIEAQLVKTEIRAPFAGIIGLRSVSVGSYLSPQTRIATLQDLDPLKLDFSVPEKYATRMRTGREVSFFVKGSERQHRGEIYAVEPGVDPETRSLTLRARCPNPEGELVPGAFADVRLVIARFEEALTVPAIAVIPELGGRKVFVYRDGKAEERRVETGLRTEDRVQIVAGLEPGEVVLTSAVQQLRPGLEVEPEISDPERPEPAAEGVES